MDIKKGDTIKIIEMQGEPHYSGRSGEVDHIDAMGQIHGSWGGLAVIPETDKIEIIKRGAEQWQK